MSDTNASVPFGRTNAHKNNRSVWIGIAVVAALIAVATVFLTSTKTTGTTDGVSGAVTTVERASQKQAAIEATRQHVNEVSMLKIHDLTFREVSTTEAERLILQYGSTETQSSTLAALRNKDVGLVFPFYVEATTSQGLPYSGIFIAYRVNGKWIVR